MHRSSHIHVPLALCAGLLSGCGGHANFGDGSAPAGSASDAGTGSETGGERSGDSGPLQGIDDAGNCTAPVPGIAVSSGNTIQPRPSGSVLRLTLIYQGSVLGIQAINGVDMRIRGTDATARPASAFSGYWAEEQDELGALLFTRGFEDPSSREVFGPLGRIPVPYCDPKVIALDVPNDPKARAIVVYGSPYGTWDGAKEIGRFVLP